MLIFLLLTVPFLGLQAQECRPAEHPAKNLSDQLQDLSLVCSKLLNCDIQPDSNQEVIHCKKNFPGYPKPVHFYIPTNLDLSQELNTFVHFHGHNIGHDHFKKTTRPGEGYGDYGDFISKAKVNGILVIPESDGKCSTYDSYFQTPRKTDEFFGHLSQVFKDQKKKLHLSGHSGAYRVLNQLAKHSHEGTSKELKDIHSIGLFDATYAPVPGIEQWLNKRKEERQSYRLYNSFVAGPQGGAKKVSLELMQKYQRDPNVIMKPLDDKRESNGVLQHFNTLRDGGLRDFFVAAGKI